MSRVIETTVYRFEELSEEAKERAREWYREWALDFDWWDSVYEDAERIAEILGIEFEREEIRLMSGRKVSRPDITFSGFLSQGDGASWRGTYSWAPFAPEKIREYAPRDSHLHEIADKLAAVQERHEGCLVAKVTRQGAHYEHSGTMAVDVEDERDEDREIPQSDYETVRDCLRGFADRIYEFLREEYEFQMSDENLDDSIIANGYEFTEDGERI